MTRHSESGNCAQVFLTLVSMRPFSLIFVSIFFACAPVLLWADDPAAVIVESSQDGLEASLNKAGVMHTEGLPERLAALLEKYYEKTFGGRDNWATISSLRFSGQLRLSSGQELKALAYMKKPNLMKIAVGTGDARVNFSMGYDGSEVWQSTEANGQAAVVKTVDAGEAANFIRDAWFGGLLLYPTMEGKRITQGETYRIDDEPVVDIKVVSPSGAEVIYTIALTDFTERKRSSTNYANNQTEVMKLSDYREVSGMQVAFKNVLTSEGAFVHELLLDKVEINQGVASWMFSRPE